MGAGLMTVFRLMVRSRAAARLSGSLRKASIIILLMVNSSEGRADSTALGLIDSFKTRIEKMDSDSERCGLTRENLTGVITAAFTGTGLSVVRFDSESDVVLDINPMTVILHGNTCVTAYTFDLLTFPIAMFRGTAGPQAVLLWSRSGIFASGLQDHVARMSEALQNETRTLVENWRSLKN
jgi:hypothetical protein